MLLMGIPKQWSKIGDISVTCIMARTYKLSKLSSIDMDSESLDGPINPKDAGKVAQHMDRKIRGG